MSEDQSKQGPRTIAPGVEQWDLRAGGQPTVADSRIQTKWLWDRHKKGETLDELAADYGIDVAGVTAAIVYEGARHTIGQRASVRGRFELLRQHTAEAEGSAGRPVLPKTYCSCAVCEGARGRKILCCDTCRMWRVEGDACVGCELNRISDPTSPTGMRADRAHFIVSCKRHVDLEQLWLTRGDGGVTKAPFTVFVQKIAEHYPPPHGFSVSFGHAQVVDDGHRLALPVAVDGNPLPNFAFSADWIFAQVGERFVGCECRRCRQGRQHAAWSSFDYELAHNAYTDASPPGQPANPKAIAAALDAVAHRLSWTGMEGALLVARLRICELEYDNEGDEYDDDEEDEEGDEGEEGGGDFEEVLEPRELRCPKCQRLFCTVLVNPHVAMWVECPGCKAEGRDKPRMKLHRWEDIKHRAKP